jgi:hypothetical protein
VSALLYLLPRRLWIASGGTFDPLSLSPCLWLPSQASYAYLESSGSPPGSTAISGTGQAGGAWRDRSGLGHHATQSATGQRLLVEQVAPLRWDSDGSDDAWEISGSPTTSTGGAVFWRMQLGSAGSNFFSVLQLRHSDVADSLTVLHAPGVGGYRTLNFNWKSADYNSGNPYVGHDLAGVGTSEWHDYAIVYNGGTPSSTSSYRLFLDGTELTVLTSSGTGGATARSALCSYTGVFATYASLPGGIGCVYALPTAPSDSQIAQVFAAMASGVI